jgi:hypothetical protein
MVHALDLLGAPLSDDQDEKCVLIGSATSSTGSRQLSPKAPPNFLTFPLYLPAVRCGIAVLTR